MKNIGGRRSRRDRKGIDEKTTGVGAYNDNFGLKNAYNRVAPEPKNNETEEDNESLERGKFHPLIP